MPMLPPHSNNYHPECDGYSSHLQVLCLLSNTIHEVMSKWLDEVVLKELGIIPSSIEYPFNITNNSWPSRQIDFYFSFIKKFFLNSIYQLLYNNLNRGNKSEEKMCRAENTREVKSVQQLFKGGSLFGFSPCSQWCEATFHFSTHDWMTTTTAENAHLFKMNMLIDY